MPPFIRPQPAPLKRLAKPLKRSPPPPCSSLFLTHYYVGTELLNGYFTGENRKSERWRVSAARVGSKGLRPVAGRYLPSFFELAGFFSDGAGFVSSLKSLWHAMQDRFNETHASRAPSSSSSSAVRASSRIANW